MEIALGASGKEWAGKITVGRERQRNEERECESESGEYCWSSPEKGEKERWGAG